MNDEIKSNDQVSDAELVRNAFHTIVWTRRLPLFVDGRGKCDSKMRHVALVMATYADGNTGARSRPSISTLMDDTGYTEDEIKGALERIERTGVARIVGQVRGVDCWNFNLNADFSEADTVESRATAKRERDRERQQRHRDKQRHGKSSVTAQTEVPAMSQGFERDGHRISSVTSQGIERDVTLNSPGTFPVPARGDLPEAYLPSLAAAPPNESGRTSTKSTKGGRTRSLVQKTADLGVHLDSLAGTELDPEPTWSLFLDAFTTRTEAEGTGWTIQGWVTTRMKKVVSDALLEHDRYKVDAAVVSCAREADKPYLDGTLQAWIATALVGPDMTRQERESQFGGITIPEQRTDEPKQEDLDSRTKEIGHEIDLQGDPEVVQADGEDEPTAPEVEVEDDVLPVGYAQYDIEDDEPETVEETVTVAPSRSLSVSKAVSTDLPWGSDEEIVQAIWGDDTGIKALGDHQERAHEWLARSYDEHRTLVDEDVRIRMIEEMDAVSRRVGAIRSRRVPERRKPSWQIALEKRRAGLTGVAA